MVSRLCGLALLCSLAAAGYAEAQAAPPCDENSRPSDVGRMARGELAEWLQRQAECGRSADAVTAALSGVSWLAIENAREVAMVRIALQRSEASEALRTLAERWLRMERVLPGLAEIIEAVAARGEGRELRSVVLDVLATRGRDEFVPLVPPANPYIRRLWQGIPSSDKYVLGALRRSTCSRRPGVVLATLGVECLSHREVLDVVDENGDGELLARASIWLFLIDAGNTGPAAVRRLVEAMAAAMAVGGGGQLPPGGEVGRLTLWLWDEVDVGDMEKLVGILERVTTVRKAMPSFELGEVLDNVIEVTWASGQLTEQLFGVLMRGSAR